MKIKIAINNESVTFIPAMTTADAEYDGFGTFTLEQWQDAEDNLHRIVLIHEDMLDWQRERYFSGWHDCTTDTLKMGFDEKTIAITLWRKLTADPCLS